jgi:ADP-ribose pyrophosphatase YjhB (NUDIX family)
MSHGFDWLRWISEAQAIAQAGLTYTNNPFDKERYIRLREMIAMLAGHCLEHDKEEIEHLFTIEKGYATPKLDVRAFMLKDDHVLLVRERADQLWTLPGGWIDVNESPSESVIRETKEETGFDVSVTRLLALWDKQKHDHPPQWPHIYKCFFHCEIIGGEATPNLEISDIDFFPIHQLPPLSTPRVTQKQIERLHDIVTQQHTIQVD